MNLKAGLWQQQTLKLTMTQELSQAIALLQYSAQELTEFLENKALENPLITIESAPDRMRRKRRKNNRDGVPLIEQIPACTFSFSEQILSQINMKQYSKQQLGVIRHLIDHIDESGYLNGDIAEIARKQSVSAELAEECLRIIQGLEPAGVGARSLQECLLIQWKRRHPLWELGKTIISEHFVPFAERKWKSLAKELKVSLKEIQEIFDEVQTFNPRPCAEFFNDQTHYIVPDAIISWTGKRVSVRFWDAALPRMKFNEEYFQKFSHTGDQQVGRFLREKFQDYQWIVKSIEQRKETLAKVITKIAEKQEDFFRKGPLYLKPMTMKELADEIGVHESTISRAVREKYVQTPSGTYPLKSFFSSTLQTVSAEATSSSRVKNAIAGIIEKEDKQAPLSDQGIADQLKANDGIVISRRTVAKYRDQLGIASSSKRKRY